MKCSFSCACPALGRLSDTNDHCRFQFSLRTLFILVVLGACSYSVSQFVHPQMVRRFAPGLAVIVFISSCGIWYSVANRRQILEVLIGCAFAAPLLSLLEPSLGVLPLFPCTFFVGGFYVAQAIDLDEVRLSIVGALVYASWPLFFRRYWATALLLAFYGGYFWFSCRYFEAWDLHLEDEVAGSVALYLLGG